MTALPPTDPPRRRRWSGLTRGGVNHDRLVAFGRRSQQVLLLAGLTGALTGLAVAAFDWITADVLLHSVLDLPIWWRAAMPLVGLLVAAAALRWLGRGASAATADEYIRSFHDTGRRLEMRPVIPRMIAAIATLGAGGSMGYEGPALYSGAAVGTAIQSRLQKYFTRDEAKVLLVAGAAAGVSAIFKAPATGLVFALEVPFQEDLARRMLLPAAISSAASYMTFVAIVGTDPMLPVSGQPPFNFVDLAGAAAVGIACGLLARVFAAVITRAKRFAGETNPLVRALAGGLALAALFAAGRGITGRNTTLGPGYDLLRWALDPKHTVALVLAVGAIRVLATAATVAGGGAGGLFIPLVIQGALVGRIMSGLFGASNTSLFPVLGIAAFLGAGYHVPLAAVVFVAEFTGRPGFIVPGLIAAVVAQLAVGKASLSPYQVAGRVGHLERRLRLPLTTVVATDTRTVPSDATVEEFFWQHLIGARQRSVAVVDGERYLGIARADDLSAIERDDWGVTTVAEVMRTDLPVATTGWSVGEAIRAMEDTDVDCLAVCDGERFLGVVTAHDLLRLDEILDRTGQGEPGPA